MRTGQIGQQRDPGQPEVDRRHRCGRGDHHRGEIVFTTSGTSKASCPWWRHEQTSWRRRRRRRVSRPILLAVSDTAPRMTSGSTRGFKALCALAQHYGRPAPPLTRPGSIALRPRQGPVAPPAGHRRPACLRAEPSVVPAHCNGVRLHAGIGYVTPDDEHEGSRRAIRRARRGGLEAPPAPPAHSPLTAASTQPIADPVDVANRSGICDAHSEHITRRRRDPPRR